MNKEETTHAQASPSTRKRVLLIALGAAVALVIAWSWFELSGTGDRPRWIVGTWKLTNEAPAMRGLRYRFFADGKMWSYVGTKRSYLTWYVDDGGTLVVMEDFPKSSWTSPGRLLDGVARRVRNPFSSQSAVRFAVVKSGDRLTLTRTDDHAVNASLERVAE